MVQLIYTDDASLNVWRSGDLTSAIEIFSQGTPGSDHHRLANLAVVRTRLKQWKLAEQDARASIRVQPTILGHIAVSIAMGGQGKLVAAKQEFNQAFLRDEPASSCLLLLIKSIIIFMAGEPDEAMRRVMDVVGACEEADKALCYVVQAQMQFLIGQTALDGKDYQRALDSFAGVEALAPFVKLPELESISLISGWNFDSLLLVIRQWTCKALDENECRAERLGSKCAEASQATGNTALADSKNDEAIKHHSAALSLSPPSRADVVVQQDKVQLAVSTLDDATTQNLDETRHVEVPVSEHQLICGLPSNDTCSSCFSQLLATTTPIIQACSQFRLLTIGNSGVGKSSLIDRVFGVKGVYTSETTHGTATIDWEFVSTANERFVVHDSLGFEAGDERHFDIVKDFIRRRKDMPLLKDQLHAIWLCLEIPYFGGRLLEAGTEKFLQRRKEILGNIALVVVLTKVDLLDMQLELDLPAGETLEHFKSMYINKHCIKPLHEAAGSDITHVIVSVEDGYSKSLSSLIEATINNMAKYYVDEAPQAVISIAQRVSIEEKIELSIAVGKKKYWNMLLKSGVFRGHTLKECLQVIYKDVAAVWNFNDPDKCLMNDAIIEALLRADNLADASDTTSNVASFASLLASGSGSIQSSAVARITGIAISLLQAPYTTYQEAKKDVKILMAFTVDLICVMQAIFLVAPGGRVTPQTVDLALRAYEKPRRFVHMSVDAFDGRLGVLPGGRDLVLEKIDALIWRYSIADHEIDELRRKIGQALPAGSS